MILYGRQWPDGEESKLAAEMEQIRLGKNLSFHFENMRKIIWPHLDSHRWHNLCRDEILKNRVTVLLGAGSTGKTHEASWIGLCKYWVRPDETCVLVSSTDIRGLRMRVWAEISMLWEMGHDKFPWLAGHMLDSKLAICTDDIDDGDFDERRVRDMRKGIVGIPTVQNGKFVGLGKWVGIKQKNVLLIADEASAMGGSFLSAFSNLNKNEHFEAIVLGNPNDPLDPLGKAAEPKDGWDAHMEPTKTEVWETRFMNGSCVNLVGTDSPNFDFPADKPARYKYLISREKISDTLSFFPKDSWEYYAQCLGVMQIATLSRRVLTRTMCRNYKALEDVKAWDGPVTKIGGLDASYGGDRCVCGYVEFGKDVLGNDILSVGEHVIVPVKAGMNDIAEDQIAVFVKNYCEVNDILPENFFHDATGRGGLGTALSRAWSDKCNPVEFGGRATDRPVDANLFVKDDTTGERRLKKCSEYYDRMVSELWYTVRHIVEGYQLRNLPEDIMEEFCMREWDRTKNNKIRLETKEQMKERVTRSPDLGDFLAIACEGARRRGFRIARIGPDKGKAPEANADWLDKWSKERQQLRKSKELSYAR